MAFEFLNCHDGEEDILCCCFFLFLSTYMFTFLFDKLNFSVHFQLFHVFCLSIHVYVNIHFIDLRSYFLMHILMYIDYLFHCQRLATRSKSTILIVLKCFQTEVCSGKTTIIYQLEGSGMLKTNAKIYIVTLVYIYIVMMCMNRQWAKLSTA